MPADAPGISAGAAIRGSLITKSPRGSPRSCRAGGGHRRGGHPYPHPGGAGANIGWMTTDTQTLEARVRSWESEYLWDLATPSYRARRREPEADSPVRTPFQRDRDRIVHSKAFRRLKHKTQVFVAPEGDHY